MFIERIEDPLRLSLYLGFAEQTSSVQQIRRYCLPPQATDSAGILLCCFPTSTALTSLLDC